jgi:hypothetical protein
MLSEDNWTPAMELAAGDITPSTFDVTIPAWIERIQLWGKVVVKHSDPSYHWGKRKVSIPMFIKTLNNQELNKFFGNWRFEKTGFTTIEFIRDYVDSKSVNRTEKFLISVKLKKEFR